MNEEDFDSSMNVRPFGTADAEKAEIGLRRSIALGLALWGRTSEQLQGQLLAQHPKIPAGFELSDFRKLERHVRALAAVSSEARFAWLPRSALFSPSIFVGTQRFTVWEARCEVVRRAIEYLEDR
jgi:hypothetical protein